MKKFIIVFIALLLVGCYPWQRAERKPDYVYIQSYNIAGSDKYIYVVAREYVFTTPEEAKEFYTSIGGE